MKKLYTTKKMDTAMFSNFVTIIVMLTEIKEITYSLFCPHPLPRLHDRILVISNLIFQFRKTSFY